MKNMKLFVTDFDGVWTDNYVFTGTDGSEFIRCNKADSLRISEIKEKGIRIVVLTNERNQCVVERCKKLNLEVIQTNDKFKSMLDLVFGTEYDFESTAFFGNDLNDLKCYTLAGIRITVPEAPMRVKRLATYITKKGGGQGAVREVFDLILDEEVGG